MKTYPVLMPESTASSHVLSYRREIERHYGIMLFGHKDAFTGRYLKADADWEYPDNAAAEVHGKELIR